MEFEHIPVLINEVIEGLNIQPDGVYVDCTVGGGGHALEIAKRLHDGTLICIDQDGESIKKAKEVLHSFSDKTIFVQRNFADFNDIILSCGFDKVDGVLLDIGVSSYQLDEASRGFSYMQDAVLDMRMDTTGQLTAKDVVNGYSQEELELIFWKYGEEKWGRRIAQFIVEERSHHEIETTNQLVEIVKKAIPASARQTGGHPAKRIFQSIRIEVNNELGIITKVIPDIVKRLKQKGRICIITFHSLEDRIVKNAFRELNTGCICPSTFPVCICDHKKELEIITKKPIVPTPEEIRRNSRAKSAKLRIGEKVDLS